MTKIVVLLGLAIISLVDAWSPWRYRHGGWPYHYESSTANNWNGWGGDVSNRRLAQHSALNPNNAKTISQHCQLKYTNGVSATPTVDGDIAYYPTWGGILVALNYKTCQTIWETNITRVVENFAPVTSDQAIVTSPVSRTSPFMQDGILYLGTLIHALLLAVDASHGAVIAQKQINAHPMAVITQAPTVYNGHILLGASSVEETAAAAISGYQCCSFVGNMNAYTLDVPSKQFNTAWSVDMLPSPPGNWSGNAVWGSQPSIDEVRSQVFIATGNVYTAPAKFSACAKGAHKKSSCLPADVYQESVMAFDISTGHINWVNQISPLDAWTVACIPGAASPGNQVNCPPTPGPDADFGMAPAFVSASSGSTPKGEDTVVVGQKNGNLYAISAVDGSISWATSTSPDGVDGGLSWGVAVDSSRVYFTAINYDQRAWKILPSKKTIHNSAWGAANLVDGSIVWDTQVMPETSQAFVPPSIANDVVVTGRTQLTSTGAGAAEGGRLVLLGAASGEMLSSMDLDAPYHGGIAVQDDYMLFGTGYENEFFNTTGSFYVVRLE